MLKPTLFAVALLALLAPTESQASSAAQWVTLGTGGGPVVQLERSRPANALVVNGVVYLFDVGDGVQRQLVAAGLPLRSVKAIFITHHHVDHNGALAPLLVTRWLTTGGARSAVYGPPGTATMVQLLSKANAPVADAPVAVGGPVLPSIEGSIGAHDLQPVLNAPTLVYEDGNIRVTAISVDHFHVPAETPPAHTPRSYAYRVEARGRTFVYSGDTGPSKNLTALAKHADVFITEVIDLRAVRPMLLKAGIPDERIGPMMAHMEQDHLTPSAIGAMAAEADVKQVVLTHLVPGLDGEADLRGYTVGMNQAYTGPVTVARDLERF